MGGVTKDETQPNADLFGTAREIFIALVVGALLAIPCYAAVVAVLSLGLPS